MKLTIEINTDNAAFEDLEHMSVVRLMDVVAHTLPHPVEKYEGDKIFDSNGNHVGWWEWR